MDEIAAVVREMQGMDRVRRNKEAQVQEAEEERLGVFACYVRRFVICGRLVGSVRRRRRGDLLVKIMGGYWEMTDH